MHAPRLVVRGPSGLALHNLEELRFEIRQEGTGVVGIAGFEKLSGGRLELYYTIDKRYRRRGFARAAAELLCKWIFEERGALRISATVNKKNKWSRRVLEHCGFSIRKEGAALYYLERINPAPPGP